ncbi:UNVERIFIED_CONTAM: spore coat associated protein JA (CotJA) [Acetivibrio alkalicellulosi]
MAENLEYEKDILENADIEEVVDEVQNDRSMHQMPSMYEMPQVYSMHGMPCIPQETVLRNVRLARAYVPFQKMCSVYSPIEALEKGTAFPELYSPYKGVDKFYKPPRT